MSKKVSFSEANNGQETENDSEVDLTDEKRQYNKFELLELVAQDGESPVDIDSCSSGEEDQPNSKSIEKTNVSKSSLNTKRKPRRKRGKGKGSKRTSKNDDLEDELMNQVRVIATRNEDGPDKSELLKYKLLKVDTRNLIPEVELKRIFGRSVIKDRPKIHPGFNSQRSKFVSASYFETKLSAPIEYYQVPKMELDDILNDVRDDNSSNTRPEDGYTSAMSADRPVYFKFVHDDNYKGTQKEFLESVNQGNMDFLIQNLLTHPAHAESIVQLSQIARVTEDYKTAADLIERSLVIFEMGFHPKFNITSATCRLSYKRPENRTLFITIFKHIDCCHRRGLRRTPFEYSKLLLSLEPDNDPLMATQLLDFFALRSEEYSYLIEFYSKWERLQKLPNLRFSLALAYFLRSQSTRQPKLEIDANLKTADQLLKEALILYPNFIIPLLDACSGEPDAALKECSYFDYSVYSKKYKIVPETVDVMVNLYVKRTFSLWKQKPVLSWLERNVAEMVSNFADGTLVDESRHLQHWAQFPKVAPKNLLRHIVLSNLNISVPPSAASTSYIDIDPFPPTDSIVTYNTSRSEYPQAGSSNSANSGTSLLEEVSNLFVRSILPSFSLSEPTLTSSNTSTNQNAPRARPTQRATIARVHPNGSGVVRFTDENGIQDSHHLSRGGMESLMTIIEGLQDLQVSETTQPEADANDNNQIEED